MTYPVSAEHNTREHTRVVQVDPDGAPFKGASETTLSAVSAAVAALGSPTTIGNLLDSGTASAGGAATITDAAKNWPVNGLAGYLIRITSGTAIGQFRQIASNTATVITVATNWGTQPVATDTYAIHATGKDLLSDLDAMKAAEAGVDTQTGQQRLTLVDAQQAATIPATTTKVILNAEGADLRYSLSGAATATSGGRLVKDGTIIFRLTSTSTLSIYGATGAYANLEYLTRT